MFLLLLLGALVTAPVAAEPGWKFHAENQNTGIYDDGGILPGNVEQWNFATGKEIYSSPAVADGVVYVGSDDHNLYAFDAVSGALLWNYTTGRAVRASPAVANDVVYFGSDDNNIYALNAVTGTFLWNYTTENVARSSPAVENGVVYVGGSASKISALDAATGALLWNFTRGSPPYTSGYVTSSPAIANGIVYVGNYDKNIYAFNAATGALLWNFTTGDYVFSSPAVANGVVYAGSADKNLYALDAATGDLLWNYTTGTAVLSSPAVENGIVYFGGSYYDKNLYAVNAATGALLWNFTTEGGVYSSPAIANGVVYAGSSDNNIYAFNAATGALLWNFTTGGVVFSSPAVSNGIVYAGSWDGHFYAIGTSPKKPPESISNLHTTSIRQDRITWAWNDPIPFSVDHVMVYLNGIFQENVPWLIQSYTATGLTPGTAYTISTRTVGLDGQINGTWVNQTVTTPMLSLSELDPPDVMEGSPAFILNVYGTGFTPDSTILWNGEWQTTQYLHYDQLSMEVPSDKIAYPHLVNITVYDSSLHESSNPEFLPVINKASDTKAWKFRSDLINSGVYDDGGTTPNGALLWNYTVGDVVSTNPAVVNGIVYFGSLDKNLYAVDAQTGIKLWNYTNTEPFGWESSSPAVANGIVYIGGLKTKLSAFDAATGTLLWNYTVPAQSTTIASVSSSPAVANGVVYVGNFDGNIYAFNAYTGALLWNYSTGDCVFSSPAVANGIVYIGSYDKNLYALDAATGTLLWNYTTGGQVYSSPTVMDGVVYIGSYDNNLYALDAATGTLLWKYTTGDWVSSSPAVANGVVYFGSYDNNTYALDATSGALLWNYTTGHRVRSCPAVANGVVYIGSYDKNLYALDAATGTLLWNYTTSGGISSSPAVVNGVVYIGSLDKNLYAIGSSPIDGEGKGYYLVHSNVDGAEVYFNENWFEGTIANGTLLVETCSTCTPVWTFTVKKCGYIALTQNNTQYPGINQTIDLYANLTAPKEPLITDFSANITETSAPPLTVGFTSQSIGIAETWNWSFGDGTYSEETNPVHIYNTSGVYTVSLFETNSACQNKSMVKPNYITVGTKSPLFADFTVSPVSGKAPLTVKCTDQSVGNPTRYYYDFGDGVNVTGPNPSHTYRFPGTFTITLTITKSDKATGSVISSSTTKTNVITVGTVPFVPPEAQFTASPIRGPAPLTVTFNDQSSGNPTFYNYDFGDGVNMTGSNPVHTYRYPGNYTVTLTVMKNDASSGTMVANSSIRTDYIVALG